MVFAQIAPVFTESVRIFIKNRSQSPLFSSSGLFVRGEVCYKARINAVFTGHVCPFFNDKGLTLWQLNALFLLSSQMRTPQLTSDQAKWKAGLRIVDKSAFT